MTAADNYGILPVDDATNENHPALAEWLTAVATWSPLRVAAGCRFHNEATLLLRQGRMDPDASPFPLLLAAIAASKAAPAALPWSNAPPICVQTIKLIANATRGWHRTTHWLHHVNVRDAVFAVLAVAERLHQKDALLLSTPPPQQPTAQRRRTRGAIALEIARTPLPLLPPEIWFHMMRFFLRSWWAVNEV